MSRQYPGLWRQAGRRTLDSGLAATLGLGEARGGLLTAATLDHGAVSGRGGYPNIGLDTQTTCIQKCNTTQTIPR